VISHVVLVERFYARELTMLTKSSKVANGLHGEIKIYLKCRLETRRKNTFFSGVSSHMRYIQCEISHTTTECIIVVFTNHLALNHVYIVWILQCLLYTL
jgi:hypothetical protein